MRKVFRTYKLSNDDKIQLTELKRSFPSLSKTILRAFYARGLKTYDDINLALNGTKEDLHSPFDLKDCDVLVSNLVDAIEKKKKIVISGDYDTDGCVGTIILMKCLRHLNANVDYYVNDRFLDGYGLSVKSLKNLLTKFPDVEVILTVDNGITSNEAVDYCNSIGIDVLITDHHKPPSELPKAKAIVNPQRPDCNSKSKNLCGAVVAWKCMLGLYQHLGMRTDFVYSLLDLACVATVGDQMTLVGESRIIVKEGLKVFNSNPRIQFRLILEKLQFKYVDSITIGYYISPMFNCISRLEGSANLIIDTFISGNSVFVKDNVDYMFLVNDKRKAITASQVEKAFTLFDHENLPNVIVIYDDCFTEGIIGLIAGRITEKFNRPSFVMCKTENGVLKGSARSVKPVDVYELMTKIKDCFIGFGGHEFAGGFSIEESKFELLKTSLEEELKGLTEDSFYKEILIDHVIRPEDVDVDLCSYFKVMEPFGYGFSKPKFLLKDYKIDLAKSNNNKSGSPFVGNDSKTLRLVNYNGLVVMMFKHADRWRELNYPLSISCVGEPVLNEFMGRVSSQFIVENDYILV